MLFEKVNDFAFEIVTETAKAVETARAMVRDAEVAATAKRKAQRHTNCRYCQAGLENFLIDFPDASDEAVQSETESLWETCGACTEEYHAHLEKEYQTHLESLEYSELDGHAFNGDDLRWQKGGVK